MRKVFFSLALLFATRAGAQINSTWTTPITPFQIADNLYYVGSKDLASYLVVTPKGDILINSNLESSPAAHQEERGATGFRWSDVKILLISHAHFDHDAGSAEIKRQTGAQYMVMDSDVPVVESGGAKDFHTRRIRYPAALRWIGCCMMAMKCGWAARCWWRIRQRATPADAPHGQ
jgi:metallo-beta-lactamase class B